MQVDHRGLDAGMAHELLDLAQGRSGFQQVRGVAVAQQVGMDAGEMARLQRRLAKGSADQGLHGVPPT